MKVAYIVWEINNEGNKRVKVYESVYTALGYTNALNNGENTQKYFVEAVTVE